VVPVSTTGKFIQMFVALGLFAVVFGGILLLAGRLSGPRGERIQSASFVGPALLLLAVGLLYPAILTVIASLQDARGETFVGLQNYIDIFTKPELLLVLRNTAVWVVLVPLLSTAIGLAYAVLVDRARGEAFAKALIFLPMAISFVAASIIWKFMYEYRPTPRAQIGVFNAVLKALGLDTYQFILSDPWNTLFLVVIMVWIEAGFAMTVLSAAIKSIPDDIIEAAKIDGVTGFKLFRWITLPSIRPAVIVVLTTIGMATLKVFDIVRTMTGGQFNTSVIANEFYNQSFRFDQAGIGAAFAVVLFILVLPIVAYNVVQLRKGM
jgi:alpha-glucoside transport system permease protein